MPRADANTSNWRLEVLGILDFGFIHITHQKSQKKIVAKFFPFNLLPTLFYQFKPPKWMKENRGLLLMTFW
jgi:hypothetical protein